MRIGAILYDLDGTLLDSERESAEAMARALRDGLGIDITQEERDFIIGRSWVDIYDNLCAGHPGLSWTRDELIAATAARRTEVFAEVGATVLPGAREAVARFDQVSRGLVTGSSRAEALQALELLGMEGAFGAVVASEDVGRSKPAPDGYLKAARQLGAAPATCVAVEDSAAGIAAARHAGACVIAVRAGNFAGQDQTGAHHVLDSLEELTPALAAELLRRFSAGAL
jgi:HAD superfamily hydrolase (TIGR01509 family)